MKKKRYIALFLSFLIIFTVFPLKVNASNDYIENLSEYKKYFRRAFGAYARAEMYQDDILASLTVSQAIYESRWGISNICNKANNLFGIKTYGSWKGKVYETDVDVVLSSLEDYRIMNGADFAGWAWRAYDKWADCIEDHSKILNGNTYSSVKGERDYKTACYNVVKSGYCSDEGYAEDLISLIETYDLTQFDDISENEFGVSAIKISNVKKRLGIGDKCPLSAEIFTDTEVSKELMWASSDESVASVSQDGEVTANAAGIALITASIGNKEACCIVTVLNNSSKYNAVTTANLYVRAEGNQAAASLGIFKQGQAINVTGKAVGDWYPVTGTIVVKDAEGKDVEKEVSGWSCKTYINFISAFEDIKITKIGFNRYEINRDINQKYQLKYVVGSAFAVDKTLTWTSCDETVASVADGLITTHKYGTATITATASSGASASCIVNVTKEQVRYKAVTTANLWVHADDYEKSTTFGYLKKGAFITVTDNFYNDDGLIDDDWLYAEGVMNNGKPGEGYSNAKYIVILCKEGEDPDPDPDPDPNPDPDPEPEPEKLEISEPFVVLDEYIYGAEPSNKAGDILKCVKNTNVTLFDKNGKLLNEEDVLTTGCTLCLVKDGVVADSVSIVIKGDINGDGKITSVDFLFEKRYFLNTINVEGAYKKAALVSGKQKVSSTDYLMIKRHFLRTYTIKQIPAKLIKCE